MLKKAAICCLLSIRRYGTLRWYEGTMRALQIISYGSPSAGDRHIGTIAYSVPNLTDAPALLASTTIVVDISLIVGTINHGPGSIQCRYSSGLGSHQRKDKARQRHLRKKAETEAKGFDEIAHLLPQMVSRIRQGANFDDWRSCIQTV